MALSDTAVKNVKPSGKTLKMFDGGGLYLEVTPKGSKRWRFKYRFQGKEKLLSLGVYPDIKLKTARGRRDDLRAQLAEGLDPSFQRKMKKIEGQERAANTFEIVAREWHSKFSVKWVSSHSGRVLSRMEKDLFPWLGNRPIAELTPLEVLTCVQRIEKRGAVETAHRALQNCGQALRRMEISKDEMSGHGFRAMARTLLDEVLEFPPHLIEHQLAHAVKDPNGRAYNRTAHLPQRKVMMQAWADYLEKLKCGGALINLESRVKNAGYL
jgi:hypothetical protein